LEECKDTHLLVAVFPLSILDIHQRINSNLFYNWFYSGLRYRDESFAKDTGNMSWQLIRKTQVPNSAGKSWSEQQALLTENKGMLTARAMVYAIIGHFLATNERLFEQIYVRCSDEYSDNRRVEVGLFNLDGLHIIGDRNEVCDIHLGLASVRKLN